MTDRSAETLPLSVFLITRDEAARLPATLAPLVFAGQIVVVDSGSTDRTCEIAQTAGAEVYHRDWDGYGPQKGFAEDKCIFDWRLNLDADEVVTPALSAEIRALFADGPPQPGAFRVRILNVYPGDAHPRPLAADYRVVRLYHREAGRYRRHALFDRVELSGEAEEAELNAPIYHHPLLSWHHMVEKENRYTSFQAQSARSRGPFVLVLRLVAEFPIAFLKFYVLRRHCLGGWKGLAFAMIAAFSRWLRIAKLLERADRKE
ncbi:MAG: glycosyltransferase family 2 protein [Pseudomonadota bacterium]